MDKQEFVIGVSWEVQSTITIKANSREEALKYAEEHLDDIPLPTENDYIDGSFKVEMDPDLVNTYGKCGSVELEVPDKEEDMNR